MNSPDFFERFFGNRQRIYLLRYFFLHQSPLKKQEIKKFFGKKNISSLSKEINNLSKLSLIKKRGESYYLNDNHFAFSEIKSLVLKFSPSFFEEAAKKFKKISSITLLSFGGVFSQENNFLLEEEKPDILIVVKKNQKSLERKISQIISFLEKKSGKDLNFMILDEKEFKYRYSMFDKFIRCFFEEKPIILINKLRGINL